jgi:antitoxin component of RelBE/YafQ-DinJ toxin-antitoxin module
MEQKTEKAAVNVMIDADVKKQAQKRAIDEGVTLTDAVERFFSAWVDGRISLPLDKEQATA